MKKACHDSEKGFENPMSRRAKSSACLETCKEASQEAQQCAAVCIKLGWRRKGRRLALLCLDTADACDATAKALMRGSSQESSFCAFCATIAHRCAEDCDEYARQCRCKFSAEACRQCAKACRRCAEACRAMAGEKHFLTIQATCYLEPIS